MKQSLQLLIAGRSWGLAIVWIAPALATTLLMFGASLPSRTSAQAAKPSTVEKADLEELQGFENYIREGKLREAEPLLRGYLKAHPGSARAYYDLGYMLYTTHKIGASIEALAKSLQLDIRNAEAHKVLGLDFTIIWKLDEAQIEMEQAARLEPDSAEIHYFLGRIYYTKNVFKLAKREFEEATRLDPSYMKAYSNLGLTMEAMGDDNTALANYEKAILLSKQQGLKSEWPYVNVCAFYNRQNKPEQALPYCQRATELNSKSDQAFFETARAHISQKDWDRAATALESAITLNPRSGRFHYVLGTVYRKLGRSADSEKEMEVSRKLIEQGVGSPVQQSVDYPLQRSDHPPGVHH